MLGGIVYVGERRYCCQNIILSQQINYLTETLVDRLIVVGEKASGLNELPRNIIRIADGYGTGDAGHIDVALKHVPPEFELLVIGNLNRFKILTLPNASSLFVEKSADYQGRWDPPLYINAVNPKPIIYLGSTNKRCEVEPAEYSFCNVLYLRRQDCGLFKKICREHSRWYLWECVNELIQQTDLAVYQQPGDRITQFTTAKSAATSALQG
jgi:hypothetical protein